MGVSAGAFICANLANNLTTAQMCRAIVSHEPGEHPFVPETFLTPAVREMVRSGQARAAAARGVALASGSPTAGTSRCCESLTRLSEALPVGIFDNRPIRDYLRRSTP